MVQARQGVCLPHPTHKQAAPGWGPSAGGLTQFICVRQRLWASGSCVQRDLPQHALAPQE
jgi:hypothetical protein